MDLEWGDSRWDTVRQQLGGHRALEVQWVLLTLSASGGAHSSAQMGQDLPAPTDDPPVVRGVQPGTMTTGTDSTIYL